MIDKILKAIWVLKQPLTKVPRQLNQPVSDLFVWRNSSKWDTFFEIIDIPGLFEIEDVRNEKFVEIYFYNSSGKFVLKKRIDVEPGERKTFNLSELLNDVDDSIGTFCVFHSFCPDVVSKLGSFISERGYVSYNYQDSPLRAYVHGNLDAVALKNNGVVEQLGSVSFLPREYRLQHELLGPALYELGVVNPSSSEKKFVCLVLCNKNYKLLDKLEIKLKPKGTDIFSISVNDDESKRIIIKSGLVMSRPLIFRINKKKLDVFHG